MECFARFGVTRWKARGGSKPVSASFSPCEARPRTPANAPSGLHCSSLQMAYPSSGCDDGDMTTFAFFFLLSFSWFILSRLLMPCARDSCPAPEMQRPRCRVRHRHTHATQVRDPKDVREAWPRARGTGLLGRVVCEHRQLFCHCRARDPRDDENSVADDIRGATA